MRYKSAKANGKSLQNQRKCLRSNATPAEAVLWRALKNRGAGGFKFRRQQGIGPFILDFYCPELRLCIELDGKSHEHKSEYDDLRTKYLNEQGIKVLRYQNEQIWTHLNDIVEEIVRVGNEIKQSRSPK
ncbi:MAG: DUF559 domain-containing protein [Prevotella sp.]|nr:DUF559 domain-containing protein [Prevotella sp.]